MYFFFFSIFFFSLLIFARLKSETMNTCMLWGLLEKLFCLVHLSPRRYLCASMDPNDTCARIPESIWIEDAVES